MNSLDFKVKEDITIRQRQYPYIGEYRGENEIAPSCWVYFIESQYGFAIKELSEGDAPKNEIGTLIKNWNEDAFDYFTGSIDFSLPTKVGFPFIGSLDGNHVLICTHVKGLNFKDGDEFGISYLDDYDRFIGTLTFTQR